MQSNKTIAALSKLRYVNQVKYNYKYYMLNHRNRTAMEFKTNTSQLKLFTMSQKDEWLYSKYGQIKLVSELFPKTHPDFFSLILRRLQAFLNSVREEKDLNIVSEGLFKLNYHEYKVAFNTERAAHPSERTTPTYWKL